MTQVETTQAETTQSRKDSGLKRPRTETTLYPIQYLTDSKPDLVFFVLSFTAQSTQWGHVKRCQFI